MVNPGRIIARVTLPLLVALVGLCGCAHQYIMTLSNGDQVVSERRSAWSHHRKKAVLNSWVAKGGRGRPAGRLRCYQGKRIRGFGFRPSAFGLSPPLLHEPLHPQPVDAVARPGMPLLGIPL